MVNVGIIGAGRIGKVHVESICTQVANAKVKMLADPFMNEETEKWAKDMGVENVTKDYKEILADPEIDAVLICSSTDTHSPISVEAIKAGKHVFCEKPIDHDVEKIKEVIDALKDSNVKYQVGFNRRFDHNFEAVQKAVADGKIGDTHIIKITSRDPEPPCADYVKVSGGIFLDMTIHDFDMVRFLAGCNATEVYVEAAVLVDPAIGEAGDVDTAVITLKMENGAIAVIDNSRKAAYGYDQRAEVFGSKGMVAVSNDSTSSAVISNAEGVTGEKPLYFFLERYMAAYALAVAIGNAHGNYPVAPQLAFDVLEKIHAKTAGLPLVLHGGSGITDEDFKKAISLGIVKVNIATASFNKLTKRAEEYLQTSGSHNYFDLNEAMVRGTYENVKHHIEVFNCEKPLTEQL